MIVEVADFLIDARRRPDFEVAIAHGVKTILSKSSGYKGHKIMSSHEDKSRVLLVVEWDSLEDHMIGFRKSTLFADWRAIISPFFIKPPHVEHFTVTDGR